MPNWWEVQLKGIQKSEELSVQIYDAESRLINIITVDKNGNYKLYMVKSGKAIYTKHKSNNPLKLEKFM